MGIDPPRNIGKYAILGILGRGAMGIVYKAKDPEIGRTVAIKVLRHVARSHTLNEEAVLERFRAEARSAGNLRHPNIITIFDVNTENGTPYIVMDYVEGEPLDRRLHRLEKINPRNALYMLGQIGAGLDYAHARNIIHRDIKPSNILIDASQHVFILDFGVARMGEDGLENEPVMGTPSYMSPEQILNKDIDYRTDLFSLAVLAFECLTGKRPYAGSDSTTVLANILKGIRFDITEVASELPLALEAQFDRALAFDKEERFLSAAEMLEAFREALSLESVRITSSVAFGEDQQESGCSWNSHSQAQDASDIREWPASPGSVLFGGTWHTPSASGVVGTAASEAIKEALDTKGRRVNRPKGAKPGARDNFLILSAAACIALGALVFWNSMPDSSEGVVSRPVAAEAIALHDFTGEDAFGVLQTEKAPPDKKVEELAEAELLGLMVSKTTPEEQLVAALHEGQRRNCRGLVEAACVLLEHDSYVVRLWALDVLEQLRDRKATGRLVRLLEDYDPVVRKRTAKALGHLGDRRALGYLKARLIKETLLDVINEIKNAINLLGQVPIDFERKN